MSTENEIRLSEQEIRRLRSLLATVLVGSQGIKATKIAGVLPKSSGGTGSNSGALAAQPRFGNNSGGNLVEGDVVILDTGGDRRVTTTTTAGHRLVLGVVSGSGAPYANGAETPVLLVGYHPAVRITGAVALGDFLRTSTSAGRGISTGSDPQTGIFAIALSTNAAGDATVKAMIFAGNMARPYEEITEKGQLLVSPAAGDMDVLSSSGATDGWVLTKDAAETLGMKWAVSAGHTIEDEGVALTQRQSLNFTGAGVSVADSGGKTVVTVGAAAAEPRAIVLQIDGGGSAITTGIKADLRVPFGCTIVGWTILADQSGDIVVDVWKDTYANFPPTAADSIAGSEKPTLSSAAKNEDQSLSTWTPAITADDILRFNVDSVATVTRVVVIIEVTVP